MPSKILSMKMKKNYEMGFFSVVLFVIYKELVLLCSLLFSAKVNNQKVKEVEKKYKTFAIYHKRDKIAVPKTPISLVKAIIKYQEKKKLCNVHIMIIM